jgi:hypothetical protein
MEGEYYALIWGGYAFLPIFSLESLYIEDEPQTFGMACNGV